MAGGVADCVVWLEQFSFDPADLDYLADIGFDPETLNRFGALRFAGDVWAIPEGRIVVANEPILVRTAPIAGAQLVETRRRGPGARLNRAGDPTPSTASCATCNVASSTGAGPASNPARAGKAIDPDSCTLEIDAVVEALRQSGRQLNPGGPKRTSPGEASQSISSTSPITPNVPDSPPTKPASWPN